MRVGEETSAYTSHIRPRIVSSNRARARTCCTGHGRAGCLSACELGDDGCHSFEVFGIEHHVADSEGFSAMKERFDDRFGWTDQHVR